MITRPPALGPEEMEKIMERLSRNGASIMMQDARVTSAMMWFMATVGTSIIALAVWGINSINKLNETMTVVVTQNTYRDDHVDRIEQHLQTVDGRVVILERKVQ